MYSLRRWELSDYDNRTGRMNGEVTDVGNGVCEP